MHIYIYSYINTHIHTPQHLYKHIQAHFINKYKFIYVHLLVKLAILVEGDPKAPFSIATTSRCGEGATPLPGLLHFTFDPEF